MPFNNHPEQGKPFANRPSDKFCVMNREFYNDLKYQISRIVTAVNVEQAVDTAKHILNVLEEKFEDKEALRKLVQKDLKNPIISDPRNADALINPDTVPD